MATSTPAAHSTGTPPFGTALIGRTEKALTAILNRQLAPTGITEPQWLTLTLAVTGDGRADRADFVRRVRHATKFTEASVAEHIAALAAAGLVAVGDGGTVEATSAGRARWTAIRASIDTVTRDLWDDVPAEDLAVAGRVLGLTLDRANALLAE